MTGRAVEFIVRAFPPSERFPDGVPERRLAAVYSPDELALMGRLRTMYEDASTPEDAARAMNSMVTLHEMKVLLDARLV